MIFNCSSKLDAYASFLLPDTESIQSLVLCWMTVPETDPSSCSVSWDMLAQKPGRLDWEHNSVTPEEWLWAIRLDSEGFRYNRWTRTCKCSIECYTLILKYPIFFAMPCQDYGSCTWEAKHSMDSLGKPVYYGKLPKESVLHPVKCQLEGSSTRLRIT